MKRGLVFILISTVALASSAAVARSVYLNGVDISAVRDRKFLEAEVTIDKDGNVHIHAPLYNVKLVGSSDQAAVADDPGGSNAALSKHYYLVTQPSKDGRAQYAFSISVNGLEKKRIAAGTPQVILEISKWLERGANEVVIKAIKDMSAGRKSFSPEDKAVVLIGVGHAENRIVKIDKIKTRVDVDAAHTTPVTQHYVLVAE